MGTDCQKQLTEEAKQWAEEAEQRARQEEANDRGWEEYAKEIPAIREAMNVRSLELLGENSDNARERIEKHFTEKGDVVTDLDKIAREVWPTHQQLHEMVVIGEKLGISDEEIISVPLICATPEAKSAETVIHDMLWAIQNQDKIPYWHKDDTVFSKIVFVDARPMGKTSTKDADFDPVTKVLFIYKGANSKFPTKEFIRDEILPHEIPHASDEFKIKVGERADELKAVIAIEQTFARASDKRDISPYIEGLEKLYEKREITKAELDVELALEWVPECCRIYTKGECSETTKKFFEELFS